MLGCLEDWRVRGIGELGEGKGLVRLEMKGGIKSEAKADKNLLIFVRFLMKFVEIL